MIWHRIPKNFFILEVWTPVLGGGGVPPFGRNKFLKTFQDQKIIYIISKTLPSQIFLNHPIKFFSPANQNFFFFHFFDELKIFKSR